MVYNGYYKVMSNIPKTGHLPTPDEGERKESARDETPETVLHPQHILCYLCIKQLLYVNMYGKAIMILYTYI